MKRREQHVGSTHQLLAWLDRRRFHAEHERMVARAVAEAGAVAPAPSNLKLPGDPFALRGIPVVGCKGGIGGAIRGSRPGGDLA